MNNEIFVFGFLGELGMSGLTLIVAIWMRSGKGAAGWLMAASTVLVLLAVVFLGALLIFDDFRDRFYQREMVAVISGALSLASVLFATGFLWDRINRNHEGG